MTRVSYAVEGWSDELVAERLIQEVGRHPWRRFVAKGKSRLDPKLPGYNASAERQPWLVLRDLDSDAQCPGLLVNELLGKPSVGMALRIPVSSVETWLMADRESFAAFFKLALSKVPHDPEAFQDAKASLVQVCRGSRSSAVRAAMVPSQKSGRKVGREYEATLREYTADAWRLDAAMEVSPSLKRSVDRLKVMVESGVW